MSASSKLIVVAFTVHIPKYDPNIIQRYFQCSSRVMLLQGFKIPSKSLLAFIKLHFLITASPYIFLIGKPI